MALWIFFQYAKLTGDLLDQPSYLDTGQILEYNKNLKQLSKDIAWIDSVYLCGYWYWWNLRTQGKITFTDGFRSILGGM